MLLVWSIAVSVGLQLLSDARLLLRGSYNNVVPADPNITRGRCARPPGCNFGTRFLVWPPP